MIITSRNRVGNKFRKIFIVGSALISRFPVSILGKGNLFNGIYHHLVFHDKFEGIPIDINDDSIFDITLYNGILANERIDAQSLHRGFNLYGIAKGSNEEIAFVILLNHCRSIRIGSLKVLTVTEVIPREIRDSSSRLFTILNTLSLNVSITGCLVGLLHTFEGDDFSTFDSHIASGGHISRATKFINDEQTFLGSGHDDEILCRYSSVIRKFRERSSLERSVSRRLLDNGVLSNLVGRIAVVDGNGTHAVGTGLVLGGDNREFVGMSSLGLRNGQPGSSFVIDIHIVLLVGGHGELELATGGGSLSGDIGNGGDFTLLEGDHLDVGLALVVVGEDKDLAFDLGGLGSLRIGSGDRNHNITANGIDSSNLGGDASSCAENIDGHLIGRGNTLNGILESDGLTGVDTHRIEGTIVRDLQGEGLLLGDLNLGLTHNQDDVILGGLVLINISGGEGRAVDHAETEGFPGFATVVGNDNLTFGAGAEQRSDTIITLVTFITLVTLVALDTLVTLVTLGGNRQRVAGFVLQQLAVDGPVVDTVLTQGDADFRSDGVVTVLTIVTILAVLDGSGGAIGEIDGVLTFSLNDRHDGDLVLNGIHQALETGNSHIVDLCDCIFEGGNTLVQIRDLVLEVREIGLLGAAYCHERDQRSEQYSPNGFSHND